jgi:hypothetical protein
MDPTNSIATADHVTMLALAAGLTGLLGYEAGWLFAHGQPWFVAGVVLVPLVACFAWSVSAGD